MKKYPFWLKTAAVFQLLTAFIHSLSLFFRPPPNNETERQIFDLMQNYKFDFGGGFHRSMSDLTTGLSICFCLACLLGGLMNQYLLRKRIGDDVMQGVININLIVFGMCFAGMLIFTFLPPIILSGLVFVFLVLARIGISNQTAVADGDSDQNRAPHGFRAWRQLMYRFHKGAGFILPVMVFSLVLSLPLSVLSQAPPTSSHIAKTKAKIEKIGIRGDLTVSLQNGRTNHGFVNRIDDESFEMTEIDLKTNLTIRYDEVKKVESGYGQKGPLGNRVGKKGRNIGRIILIGLAAFVTIAVVVGVTDKRN